MADDKFGFPGADVPKSLNPPPGYEAVHQPGMSWARQGDRAANTSWISVEQWNHLIAQFRGLATAEGIDVSDLTASSPLLLRDFVQRAMFAMLTNALPGNFGVMDKATYDADDDGVIDRGHGGTGFSATTTANLLAKLEAAPLASPALTGTPTAPTQAAGNNTTRIATTAFVQAAVAALVASSPAALDTLNELAAALGNDANFAATMTNALAAKAPLASPALTGNPTAPTQAAGNSSTRIATTAFVQAAVAAGGDWWAWQPIGVPIPLMDNLAGVAAPPTDRAYRYVLLTAGETGSGKYNNGILTSESVTGTAPLVVATAVISLAGSPVVGATINLINTERRFLRAGSAGAVQNDAMQQITGAFDLRVTNNGANITSLHAGALSSGAGTDTGTVSAASAGPTDTRILFDSANSPSSRTDSETRSKNIGVTYYVRIK